MHEKWLLAGAALALFTLPSCVVGPKQFSRSVDDWDNKLYTESPWMDVLLTVVPVIPLASVVAGVGDFLIVNPVAFWLDDAWDSHGTAFQHFEVKGEDGQMRSLLMNDSKALRVNR